MRKDSEVRGVYGIFGDIRWAPVDSKTYNPAFDVTPVDLLTVVVVDENYYSQEDLKSGKLTSLF